MSDDLSLSEYVDLNYLIAENRRIEWEADKARQQASGEGRKENFAASLKLMNLFFLSGVVEHQGPIHADYRQNPIGMAHMALIDTARRIGYEITSASHPHPHDVVIKLLEGMAAQAEAARTEVTQISDDGMETRTFNLADALRDRVAQMKGALSEPKGKLPFGSRPSVAAVTAALVA